MLELVGAHGDVFVSADPRVNADLPGGANGDRVSWYIAFAQSSLVHRMLSGGLCGIQ
jgi:hypothetical protein